METYSDNPEGLTRWQARNTRLVQAALDIEAVRNELEGNG
jgi:hypothetical protein